MQLLLLLLLLLWRCLLSSRKEDCTRTTAAAAAAALMAGERGRERGGGGGEGTRLPCGSCAVNRVTQKAFFFLASKYLQFSFFLKLKMFFSLKKICSMFFILVFRGQKKICCFFFFNPKMGVSGEKFWFFYYYCSILGKLILPNFQYHKISKKKRKIPVKD